MKILTLIFLIFSTSAFSRFPQCMIYVNKKLNTCTVDKCSGDVREMIKDWEDELDQKICKSMYSTYCEIAVKKGKVTRKQLCESQGHKYVQYEDIIK
ncbi:MAG: hypothetical protein H6622_11240 [Halobacteriovoraceae bacterium]|nr:hypothetical protein [Halobacteriovoraceae bacterium]